MIKSNNSYTMPLSWAFKWLKQQLFVVDLSVEVLSNVLL